MEISVLYMLFGIVFILYLMCDLFIFNRKAHEPTFKSILTQTFIAIGLALVFSVTLWFFGFNSESISFTTVYITEKMLSLDNLFVMLVIFQFFAVEKKYQHRVLFFGILGAIVFRLVFILAGSALVSSLHWIMYLFAIILIITGVKVLKGGKEDHHEKLKHNKLNRFLHKYIPYTTADHNGKFLLKVNGKKVLTTLAFALILIEASDIVFALDSIPAAFSITQDPAIIFTANIAAILGLRSLFFLVEWLLERLKYLSYGLGAVLIFIGGKFIFAPWFHLSPTVSLMIILAILSVVTVLSLCKNRLCKIATN
jgi:tellurite resistance protein TerC